MALGRLRAIFGTAKRDIPGVIARSTAMHAGLAAHAADYPSPNPGLAAFLTLIQNLTTAQQDVPSRTIGAAAARDVQRDLLWTGMEIQRIYVQSLADASPSRAVSLIQNAGLVVAAFSGFSKPLLGLSLGVQPGTVNCIANVSLLVGTGTIRPHQQRLLMWEYTLDGGKTFVSMPPTPGCKTVITGVPLMTIVGVRVSLTNMVGPGAWSQVVTIPVH